MNPSLNVYNTNKYSKDGIVILGGSNIASNQTMNLNRSTLDKTNTNFYSSNLKNNDNSIIIMKK